MKFRFDCSFSGDEFNRAIAVFSEKYLTVELKVSSGNHEDLYDGLRFGKLDLALNDQHRALSDAYENLILTLLILIRKPLISN